MKDMGRVFSILPVEYLVVHQVVHSLPNKVLVSKILHELDFLVFPKSSVSLYLKAFFLAISIILFGLHGNLVYWILEFQIFRIPFYWIRPYPEQVNEKIRNVVVVSGLVRLKTSHAKDISVEIPYLCLGENAKRVRISHPLNLFPVPLVRTVCKTHVVFWVYVEILVVVLIFQNLDVSIVSKLFVYFPSEHDLGILPIHRHVPDHRKLLYEIIVHYMDKQRPCSPHGVFLRYCLYVLPQRLYMKGIVA